MSVELVERVGVPPNFLFEALLSERDWWKMGRGAQTEVDGKVGGQFKLFGGGVTGEFTKLDKDSVPLVIGMKWRFSQWEESQFSDVTIVLEEEGRDCTKLTIKQENIPKYDKHGNGNQSEHCEKGWKHNILEAMDKILMFPILK